MYYRIFESILKTLTIKSIRVAYLTLYMELSDYYQMIKNDLLKYVDASVNTNVW